MYSIRSCDVGLGTRLPCFDPWMHRPREFDVNSPILGSEVDASEVERRYSRRLITSYLRKTTSGQINFAILMYATQSYHLSSALKRYIYGRGL